MIHIQRAYPAPATLTSDKAQEARAELERQVQAGQTEVEIADIYRAKDVKQALKDMQHSKCCFCESKITHVAYGDVEHFRPKKAVLEDGQLRRPAIIGWLIPGKICYSLVKSATRDKNATNSPSRENEPQGQKTTSTRNDHSL